jgi:KDO2-lipid IV(A) lauroyltransferase
MDSTMSLLRIRHLTEYFLFRVFVCVIESLPTRTSVSCARALAFIVHRILPRRMTRYQIARENLQRAFGDELSDQGADKIIHDMWVHLFRLSVEIIQLPRKMRLYNCADIMRFRNRNECVRAMCAGRPVMTIGGHFGNWEVANCATGWFGFPMGVVARDLDNPLLNDWFERFRRHTGHRLISKKGGGQQMIQYLENRGCLALLGDQDAGPRGLFLDFFGVPASTFKSIALVALEHRAVICVAYARRLPDDFENTRWVNFEIGCEEIIDPLELDCDDEVREITERFTKALERIVRLAPEQYLWVHRRWKSVPGQRRKRARKAAKAA